MKFLSYILGVLALTATIVLAVNWSGNHKHAVAAAKDQTAFTEQSGQHELAAEMRRRADRLDEQTDELKLDTAEKEISIAEMEGHGMAKALSDRSKAQAMLDSDRLVLRSEADVDAFGGDFAANNARGRADASGQALAVYAAAAARDERFAYIPGVLWIAFGFAAALATKK